MPLAPRLASFARPLTRSGTLRHERAGIDLYARARCRTTLSPLTRGEGEDAGPSMLRRRGKVTPPQDTPIVWIHQNPGRPLYFES